MIIIGSPNRNRVQPLLPQLVSYGNGLMYNHFAFLQANFAPIGWHSPSIAEWTTLVNTLSGVGRAGGKMKSTRTSAPYFSSPNTGATNSSGFTAFGGGRRIGLSGTFGLLYTDCLFWTTDILDDLLAYKFSLTYLNAGYSISEDRKRSGYSVRFIKDDSNWNSGMTVTDKDDNKYATVKIGNQVWLASNFKCTKYNDGTSIPNVTNNTTWRLLNTPAYCSYNNAAILEYLELF